MAESSSIWTQLRRRHVVRAGVAHIVFFWLLAQIAETVLPYVGIVDEPVRWAVVTGVALFPVTLVVAWFVEHPWHRQTSSRLVMDLMVIGVIAITAVAWVAGNLPQVVYSRSSIVILPFNYSEEDGRARSLSRALAYEINGLLMKSESLDVIGYESANSSRLRSLDIQEIGSLLDVRHLLTGAIVSAGDPFRLSVSLLDSDGNTMWSQEFEERTENLFGVQEQIASEVQSRLGASGTAVPIAEIAVARCPMPTHPSALDRYYSARNFVEARTASPKSIAEQNEAVRLYQSLIADYPEFAQARSGLAWALMHLSVYDPENNEKAAAEAKAIGLAEEALAICPQLGEALVLMPNEADHSNPFINSYQQLQLWMSLQPELTEAVQKYVRHLREVGRLEDALDAARRNYALNPLSVRSIKVLSATLQYLRLYDEAIELQKQAAELGSTSPDFAVQAKKMDDCQEDLDCLLANLPPPFQPMAEQLRAIYERPASPEEARQAVERAMAIYREQPWTVNWFNASSCSRDHLTPLFFELWEENKNLGAYWFWPNVWLERCGNVWADEAFPGFAEDAGLVEYWREVGWADACEPLADGFRCGQDIFDRHHGGR